jgi:hypothetical protein
MGKTTKLMLVVVMCFLAVAAVAQNQLPASSTQTPTYNTVNGAPGTTKGVDKFGALPSGAATIGYDNGYAFAAGQQFNSKWQMIGGNHDLTSNASGIHGAQTWTTTTVKASSLCSFCHTAHDNEGTADRTFLWAHEVPASFGTPYSSPTLQSTPQTTATSQTAQCLGCHDGTLAITSGGYGMPKTTEEFTVGGTTITSGGKLLESTGYIVPLSRTHPVSFTYDASLAAKHQLRVPASATSVDGYGIVPLFGTTGTMECATCHDPHIGGSGIMRRQFPTGASQDAGTGSFCMYCHL